MACQEQAGSDRLIGITAFVMRVYEGCGHGETIALAAFRRLHQGRNIPASEVMVTLYLPPL